MTREQAKNLLPIITAFAEGKTIGYREHNGHWSYDPSRCFTFNEAPERYKIKPEPSYRPWKLEEVPVGAIVRSKIGGIFTRMIVAVEPHGKKDYPIRTSEGGYDCMSALLELEYSIDNGKTWHPCGVVIE